MAEVATEELRKLEDETMDASNSVFNLGAVVGDLTIEEDSRSNDISLEGLQQELEECKTDELRKMLDLLVHGSQCRAGQCQYPNCRKVKGLFRHGMHCKVRASGGCPLCKKMWHLLQLHARSCKDTPCTVPRCRDLREHLRRLTQQADSRRRAAVMEMMRQRAAEVAGSSG